MPVTHYDILEISERASPEVVRAAYRSLIQRFHPDRRPDDPEAAARAAAITEAYDLLSDPARRAAYDQWLASQRAVVAPQAPTTRSAAASRAPAAPGRTRTAPPAAKPQGLWMLALLMLLVVAAGLWWARGPRESVEPTGDWSVLRQRFSASGQTESELRELLRRKEALLKQSPELQARAAAEESRDREARTLELLDAALEVPLDRGVLTIPRMRLQLGSFDAAALRSYILKNREQLIADLGKSLAATPADRLVGAEGAAQLQAAIQQSLALQLGIQADEEFPSTWFESPGRYGVVAVLLPEHYRFRPYGA